MTLSDVCKYIAGKITLVDDWDRVEKYVREINDGSPARAAAWLKKVVKPEYFPDVDPDKIEEDYYTLVCYDAEEVYFCRKYRDLKDAQAELERQYEYCRRDNALEFEGMAKSCFAWLPSEENKVSDYMLNWMILNSETNRLPDYTPLQ